MEERGEPPTLAPEICVEVMGESNDMEEMLEKAQLYFELDAKEVWIVTEDGAIQFFQPGSSGEPEEGEESALAPGCPNHV